MRACDLELSCGSSALCQASRYDLCERKSQLRQQRGRGEGCEQSVRHLLFRYCSVWHISSLVNRLHPCCRPILSRSIPIEYIQSKLNRIQAHQWHWNHRVRDVKLMSSRRYFLVMPQILSSSVLPPRVQRRRPAAGHEGSMEGLFLFNESNNALAELSSLVMHRRRADICHSRLKYDLQY